MILSLETSSSQGSWALLDDSKLIATATFQGRASSTLLSSLENSPLPLNQLPAKAILIGVGPGSFGGIRVAIATAQGLARAWACPVIPVLSSSALAWKYRHISCLGHFVDAKRNQNFFTAYEYGRLIQPSRLIPKTETKKFRDTCLLALSSDPLEDITQHESPHAQALAEHYLEHGPDKKLSLEPIYLHPPLPTPSATKLLA
jgi:tRNA threonylcarbamoyl adenosine modification protein YeaZ